MNILFVATVYNHLAAFHKPFIRKFQKEGYTVHVAGSNSMGRKKELEQLGVICHDINFDKSIFSKNNLKALRELKELFYKVHFNLIHVHTPIAAFLVRFVLRKKKSQGPLIYTAHGFHFFEGAPKQNWLIYYSAEKLAARWTDHLITINEEDYETAHKLLPDNKISYVHGVGVEPEPIMLDLEEKNKLKRDLGLDEQSVVIACIAELNDNKNHLFLLRNWKVLKSYCPNLTLLLIGNGEKEEHLKGYTKDELLLDVHFLGFRRDVSKLLKISDIVTLLSYREGLPKSIMEAMVEGLPCIVTNTRGLRDLVNSKENGFVINHDDDLGLIESFQKLALSIQLREEMGRKAKLLVQPFLLENVLPEYKEIYRNALK